MHSSIPSLGSDVVLDRSSVPTAVHVGTHTTCTLGPTCSYSVEITHRCTHTAVQLYECEADSEFARRAATLWR